MFEDEFLSIKKVIHGTGNYSNKLFKVITHYIVNHKPLMLRSDSQYHENQEDKHKNKKK